MIRRFAPIASCAMLLASCGGGGTSPALPVGNTAPQSAVAQLSFKLPGKALLTQLRRPLYISQGTQGIAIDWASTDPTHPDFSAPVSATCPSTLPAGVIACTIDSQGNTDYTFQLTLAPANYTFTIAAFDQPPSSGTFTGASTHMLAEGTLTTPVSILPGQPNTIPSMTFYGVPAAVSLSPGPGEKHVVFGNPGWYVIGNAPQTFYAQAYDAQGYDIAASDSGAPAITVAEASSDATKYFAVASTTTSNVFTFTAQSVPPANTSGANIVVTATANGGVQGTATANVPVTPIEELWTTETTGGTAADYGIAGYALLPPNYGPPGYFITPLDLTYDDKNLNLCGSGQCQFGTGAFSGNIAVAESAATSKLYEFIFSNATGTYTMPTQPLPFMTSGGSISNVALDAAGHLFVLDNTTGYLDALNAPTDSAYTYEQPGMAGGAGLAVAPSTSAIPSSLQQTIWAGDSGGKLHVFSSFASGMTPLPAPVVNGSAPTAAISAIGFDAAGNLWLDSSGNIYAYSINAATSPITLTFLATLSNPILSANNFGASAADGSMWFGSLGALYSNETKLTLSGCPAACAISASTLNWPAPAGASYVVP